MQRPCASKGTEVILPQGCIQGQEQVAHRERKSLDQYPGLGWIPTQIQPSLHHCILFTGDSILMTTARLCLIVTLNSMARESMTRHLRSEPTPSCSFLTSLPAAHPP